MVFPGMVFNGVMLCYGRGLWCYTVTSFRMRFSSCGRGYCNNPIRNTIRNTVCNPMRNPVHNPVCSTIRNTIYNPCIPWLTWAGISLCAVLCQDLGLYLWLECKINLWRAVGVSLFRVWLTWRRAPCLVRDCCKSLVE